MSCSRSPSAASSRPASPAERRSSACWPIRARSALVKNFAGQWLFLRNIARIAPDPASFPNFDENLRDALAKETELLIESMLRRGQQRRRSA